MEACQVWRQAYASAMDGRGETLYLEIYRKAHNNAVDLLREAELLQEHGAYARAYAVAYTALEEVSKSQFAADVYTGLHTATEFRDFYRNHAAKLDRVAWAHLSATSWPYNLRWIGPDPEDVDRINPGEPVFAKRQAALYVDVDASFGKVLVPEQQVTEKDAEDIIQVVEVAIRNILDVERDQGRIGTKGFMK